MATITRYVNPGSDGGDGTTTALTGANAAYASLNAWEAAEETDLVTAGNIHVVNCAGSTADTIATITLGWVTGESNYIEINGDHSTGIYSTSYYRLEAAPVETGVLILGQAYIRINNLQIYHNGGSPANEASAIRVIDDLVTSDMRVKSSILRGGRYTFRIEGVCESFLIENSIIYEGTTGGCATTHSSSNLELNNVVITDYGTNGLFEYAGTITANNCAVFNGADDFNSVSTIDYCASDDGDGTNAVDISPGATEADDWNDAFTDYANGDFSVKNSSSVLYDAASATYAPADDIIGTERPQGSADDIGAFELSSAGVSVTVTPSQPSADSRELTLSIHAPTIKVDHIATPGANSLSISLQTPTVTPVTLVSPSTQSLNLTLQTPTISAVKNITITPSSLSIVLALAAPVVRAGATISPSALGLTLSLQSPSIGIGILTTPSALALTLNQHAPSILNDRVVFPSTLALNASLQTPSINVDHLIQVATALGLTLTLQAPSPVIGVEISPAALGLTVALASPSIAHDRVVFPASLGITIETVAPSILYDRVVFPDALGLNLSLPVPSASATVIISVSALNLTLALTTPDVLHDCLVAILEVLSLTLNYKSAGIVTNLAFPEALELVLSLLSPEIITQIKWRSLDKPGTSWNEKNPSAAVWGELKKPAVSFEEKNPGAGTWSEKNPPAGTFNEISVN